MSDDTIIDSTSTAVPDAVTEVPPPPWDISPEEVFAFLSDAGKKEWELAAQRAALNRYDVYTQWLQKCLAGK